MEFVSKKKLMITLFCAVFFVICGCVVAGSFINNKKQLVETANVQNPKWSAEQLQGLINSRN